MDRFIMVLLIISITVGSSYYVDKQHREIIKQRLYIKSLENNCSQVCDKGVNDITDLNELINLYR